MAVDLQKCLTLHPPTTLAARRPRGVTRRRWLAALAGLVLAVPPAVAIEVPQRFSVEGTGALTMTGPGCCGGPLPGYFAASYEVDSLGNVTFDRFELVLEDQDLMGVGLFGLGHVALRCAGGGIRAPFAGALGPGGELSVAADALTVEGVNYKQRDGAGQCTEPTFGVSAGNPRALYGLHEPASIHDPAGRFRLGGTFSADLDGDPYTFTLALEGGYRNRPPVAALGLVVPGFEQGGCPALWEDGNPPEWRVEANHPQGFKAGLQGFSYDPDGVFGRNDVYAERWFHLRDGGRPEFLGIGADLGTRLFEYGPNHLVRLLVTDREGAAAAAECGFRVVDRTPPAVVAPPPVAVACSEPGGAAPRSSPELAAFLAAASASDAGDAAPVALPVRVGGAEVSDGTLFPVEIVAGGPVEVEFRFRDAAGNEGSALSAVSVYDAEPPALTVTLAPVSAPPGPGKSKDDLVQVTAGVAVDEPCSPVTVWLESITSNAPHLDADDVLDAAYGTDDRTFWLRARPATPAKPRVYEVTYMAMDRYGFGATATATFTVAPE